MRFMVLVYGELKCAKAVLKCRKISRRNRNATELIFLLLEKAGHRGGLSRNGLIRHIVVAARR